MNDQSMFIVNYEAREVTATDYVRELEETALAESALIGKVSNAAENESAVKAQLALKTHIKAITDAEDAIKGPINELKSKVIALAKSLRAQCDAEGLRLARLCGEFQESELIRQRETLNAANAELTELRRKEAIELAAAPDLASQDEIKERYAMQYLALQQPAENSGRTKGQTVKQDWDIELVDAYLLARVHPGCVDIKPRLSEIKVLLNSGVTVSGIKATKTVKAGVRVSTKETKAIEA